MRMFLDVEDVQDIIRDSDLWSDQYEFVQIYFHNRRSKQQIEIVYKRKEGITMRENRLEKVTINENNSVRYEDNDSTNGSN